MYNLLIAFGLAAAIFLGVTLAGFSPWAAIVPAMIALIATNIGLSVRITRKIRELFSVAEADFKAQRFDKGVKTLEEGFKYAKWQLLVESELHANLGLIHYSLKNFDKARPHLEKASARGPAGARAKAMLGCLHFQAKEEQAMTAAFEQAVKAGKKEGIVWSAYAFCLNKLGKRDDALKVLGRAVEQNPSDEKLKANLVALQNDKKMKMKAYEPEWFQYHLEKPRPEMGGFHPGGGRRVFQRR